MLAKKGGVAARLIDHSLKLLLLLYLSKKTLVSGGLLHGRSKCLLGSRGLSWTAVVV